MAPDLFFIAAPLLLALIYLDGVVAERAARKTARWILDAAAQSEVDRDCLATVVSGLDAPC